MTNFRWNLFPVKRCSTFLSNKNFQTFLHLSSSKWLSSLKLKSFSIWINSYFYKCNKIFSKLFKSLDRLFTLLVGFGFLVQFLSLAFLIKIIRLFILFMVSKIFCFSLQTLERKLKCFNVTILLRNVCFVKAELKKKLIKICLL